jgi:hypothetical protein
MYTIYKAPYSRSCPISITTLSPVLLYNLSVTTETPVDHLYNVSNVSTVYHTGTGWFPRIHLHGNMFITQGRVCLQESISVEKCLSHRDGFVYKNPSPWKRGYHTRTGLFTRIHLHGKVFVNSFPSNGSTYPQYFCPSIPKGMHLFAIQTYFHFCKFCLNICECALKLFFIIKLI